MLDGKEIGKRLRTLRGIRTRRGVSKETGISYSTLSAYESGERIPGYDARIKLAGYYNVTVDELFYLPAATTQS